MSLALTVPPEGRLAPPPGHGATAPGPDGRASAVSAAWIEAEFLRLAPALFRYLYARTRRVQDAEDLLADVFERIWRYRDQIQRPAPYFFMVACHCADRYLGRRSRAGSREMEMDEDDTALGDDATVGGMAEAARRHLDPQAPETIAFFGLRDHDREMLVLHCVVGLDIDEVAEVLGIGKSAAQKRWERAREHYYQNLAAVGVHPPEDWRHVRQPTTDGPAADANYAGAWRGEVANDDL